MSEDEKIAAVSRRPGIISFVCLITIVMAPVSIWRLITNAEEIVQSGVPKWVIPFSVIMAIMTIASLIGYFDMRRWGVHLYLLTFAIGNVGTYISGLPVVSISLVTQLFVIVLGILYYKKMV
jgi:hypothetical protein